METQKENQNDDIFCNYEKEHKRGKIIGGILVILAGSLLMARELGAEIPYWVFTWKTFLIGLGIVIGIKHNFRHFSWIILVLIGSAYLVSDIYPDLAFKHLLWPILVIMLGLMMIFRPKRRFKNRFGHRHRDWKKWQEEQYPRGRDYSNYGTESSSPDDTVESVTFMGGVKKKITSKNFKSGEIVVIFGGAEIDFSQADINEQATLEIVQVFGGTKLIVPANWEIKSELVSIFGSTEDKRMMQPPTLSNEPKKVLILRGTTIFGGTDIKSF
jgi:predicted membrane protein